MESISTGITTALGWVGTGLEAITGNVLLATIMAASVFVPMIFMIVRKIKNVAKH